MFVKLFLPGRPGCGKSRTAKTIKEFIHSNEWSMVVTNFKDYDILYEMARKDVLHKKFDLHEDGSFDVKDASVLNEALWILEDKVRKHYRNINVHQSNQTELIIIEFARSNYDDAFRQFSPGFLQDAHFLLIDADFDTCKERIEKRVASSEPDNHNVSDFAMDTYYKNQHPPTDTTITPRLTILTNNGEWDDFTKELKPFIKKLLHISDT